jgi:hypothetical protein
MAKIVDDSVLDAALNKIKTATRQVVCSGQPANFAGISALNLAQVTMASGDFTLADDTSGRKVTMASKSSVSISATNTATHVSLDDGTTLLYVTTCTSQALTSGGTLTIPAWKVNIQDPT